MMTNENEEPETLTELQYALVERLQEPLLNEDALEKARKELRSVADNLAEDLEYRLCQDLADNIAWEVKSLAEKSIQAMLDGNEGEFSRYVTAKDFRHDRAGEVIHGKIFEYGPEVTCSRLVERYADLLRDNRVADLEAQVAGLLRQVNEAKAEVDRLSGYA